MKKALVAAATAMMTLCASQAMADDTVAVLKIDISNASMEEASNFLLDALRSEVSAADRTLDSNGSDITYSEMQMLTGCDKEASIACYESACETLGTNSIVFGSMGDEGMTHLLWYVAGKGIYREVTGTVNDKDSADTLAQRLVVGEVGTLVVTSNIPGADVFIDGKRVGMTAEYIENAQPIRLQAGSYIVSVRKEGYEKSDSMKVVITGGEQSHISTDLIVALDTDKIQNTLKYAGFAALGVGAAGFIAGGVMEGLMAAKQTEMEDAILKDHKANEAKDLNDTGKTLETGKLISYIVGGVGVAAGTALVCIGYFFNFESDDAMADAGIPSINVAASPEFSGVNLGWKF